MEQIWFKDIKHLFTEDNFAIFIPTKDMTFAEQMNAILRLTIYFSVIVFLLRKNSAIFMVPVFFALFSYLIYNVDMSQKTVEKMFLNENDLHRDTFTKEICQKPSEENPFMNVLMSDYALNPEKKKACDVSKTYVKKQAQKYFDKKLYRSVSDVFNKEASDRQWVTNPITTIPNDQESFAKWCYGKNETCKEGDGDACYSNTFRTIGT
jgi:hypothetical protein